MTTIANTDMAAAWDGEEGARWAENADHYERGGWRMWEQFVEAVPVARDAIVLDIGCGTGKSTRAFARAAADGSALGIDLSTRMLALARERAAREGIGNARFEHADAQVHAFGAGVFDLVISSFGCMFFADPDHVRRVLTLAGFADVRLDEIDALQELGTDADDAFSFVRTMGVVKGLTEDLDEVAREQALTAIRETMAAHQTPDGVLFGAAAWLVTARR